MFFLEKNIFVSYSHKHFGKHGSLFSVLKPLNRVYPNFVGKH